jgi:hypothetical protein
MGRKRKKQISGRANDKLTRRQSKLKFKADSLIEKGIRFVIPVRALSVLCLQLQRTTITRTTITRNSSTISRRWCGLTTCSSKVIAARLLSAC